MHKHCCILNRVIMVLTAGVLLWSGATAQAYREPVVPNASEEARRVLRFLYDISGKGILGGMTDDDDYRDITGVTGRAPGYFAEDWLYKQMGPGWRPGLVTHFKEKWSKGVIVSSSWHICPPLSQFENTPCSWSDCNQRRPESLNDDVLTQGTTANRIYIQWVDEIAGYLKQLADANVPIIWRPFHEMNGCWFWWSCQPRFKELWIQQFNRLVHHHKLNNLLWCYAPNYPGGMQSIAHNYPGHEYVDILAVDIYTQYGHKYDKATYDDLLSVGEGRPIGISECGAPPDIDMLRRDLPKYTFFAPWGMSYARAGVSDDFLRTVYRHDYTLTQGEFTIPPLSGVMARFTVSPQSGLVPQEVSVDASASTPTTGLTYSWNFGDGGTASGVTAGHTYNTGGSFTISLTVSDGDNQHTATTDITVTDPADQLDVLVVNDDQTGAGLNQFDFSSGWSSATGGEQYEGDEHYSSTADATCTFTFYGSQVVLYGTKDMHHGIAAVSVDGGAETSIDYYAAQRKVKEQIWVSPSLAEGVHEVTIRVTGEKSAASTGAVVTVDRIEVRKGSGTTRLFRSIAGSKGLAGPSRAAAIYSINGRLIARTPSKQLGTEVGSLPAGIVIITGLDGTKGSGVSTLTR